MSYTLLVIDDQEAILHAFRRAFRSSDCTLHSAGSAREGLDSIAKSRPDVIVLDVHLPDGTGLEVYERIRQVDARIPVIMITGHGTTDLAIEAMKHGAFEYLLKPLELPTLRALVEQAAASSRRMHVPAIFGDGTPPDRADVLVGRCAAMQDVYKAIGRVARQDVTVLIQGESGTGKELVARGIYQHSHRSGKPFLAINCAAIPENLIESELFGHEKGAFTGADRKRIGKFEQCNGGTLFLDEVGDMTPLTQTKILRILQQRTFERVGGSEEIQTDVRVIAATNAKLDQLVAKGQFRGDLFFRLNDFPIHLPPLREREGDLALLVDYYLRRYSKEMHIPLQAVAPETLELLGRYTWPGNVRELQSVLKKALLQMRGAVLTPDAFSEPLSTPPTRQASTEVSGELSMNAFWDVFVQSGIAAGSDRLYDEALAAMERELLTRVLQHTQGNQLQAARILGINRGSLRNKIRSLHITIERNLWSDSEHDD